jgi:hypothetical protein
MGNIASASTVYATAYLTELGRQYLFNSPSTPRYKTLPNGQTIDRLKIERFSLGDPDVNYNIPYLLESGDVPDLSGENESAVKGAKGRMLTNIISPGETNLPKDDIEVVEYKETYNKIDIDLKKALADLPTVFTQQLITIIDGEVVQDGVYMVTPTNYGKNKVQNNELIITLKEATLSAPGYRLRIFYPTTGSNYNKMTFQFEKSESIKASIVNTVNTLVTPVGLGGLAG